MSGTGNERLFSDEESTRQCAHNVVRRKRDDPEFYVCGSCAKLFTVREQHEAPKVQEPMFDRRPPWGCRNRQA